MTRPRPLLRASVGVHMTTQVIKGDWWDAVRSRLNEFNPDKDGVKVYVYGPTQEDAKRLIESLEDTEVINGTTTKTAKGVLIRARPSEAESVRGDAPHLAVFVRVEAITKDFWWKFAFPLIMVRPTIVAGQPCGRIKHLEHVIARGEERAKRLAHGEEGVKMVVERDPEPGAAYAYGK